jgi:hypothetical protein
MDAAAHSDMAWLVPVVFERERSGDCGMNEQTDWVDSHTPIDFDPERDEAWPLPEPRKFEPKAAPDWRDGLRALVERVKL